MEISAKLIDSANASVSAKIDSNTLEAQINKLAAKAAKKAKIDGFRVGKVPVAEVLKRYRADLENDAKQDMYKQVIDEALKQVDKKASDFLGNPVVDKFDDENGKIYMEIIISFKPKVDLAGYETLIPQVGTVEVSESEIDARIEDILKSRAKLVKSNKEVLQKGDYANFDFEGFLNEVAFEGGSAQNYVLEIGSNNFIPGFEDQMIGLKVGEQKDINVTFPEDYQGANLAGKPVVFKVKLNEIQEKEAVKLSEENLKEFYPAEKDLTIEELKKRIKDQISAEKLRNKITNELKPKFADAMFEKYSFELPRNIVEQEIDMQFRNYINSLSEDEIKTYEGNKEKIEAKREEFRGEAQKSVTLTFIVDELAKLRNISADDHEVSQMIYMEAYMQGMDPKQYFESYKEKGLLPAMKMYIIENKLFDDIFKK